MNIYEFITPSDPITFLADDDKVALCCALVLGKGKAGCRRFDADGKEINIPSMQMFNPDMDAWITEQFGGDLDAFIEGNRQAIGECFLSFAYGDINDRKTYDDAMEAITDEVKREAFRAKHEDRNRSSLSQWVKGAWQLGAGVLKPLKQAA